MSAKKPVPNKAKPPAKYPVKGTAEPTEKSAAKAKPAPPGSGQFYFIVTPGFEEIAAKELSDWVPGDLQIQMSRGGLELELPLEVGFALNRCLKTPTRILVRLMDFGCRDFPRLYKKCLNFVWDQWIPNEADVEFHVSTHQSRLRIKKRIESTCEDARKKYVKAHPPTDGKRETSQPKHNVYVRLQDDVCTVSLDTSGEILHKRGLRPLSSDAPIRESTAASLLLYLRTVAPLPPTAAETGVELVDPMMGGGTFLMEAALLTTPIQTREFAYESFVSTPASRDLGTLRSHQQNLFTTFVGYEVDAKTRAAAEENIAGLPGSFTLVGTDFFASSPLPTSGRPRWCITNPPYGERLKVEGRLSDYYSRLLSKAAELIDPDAALFIFPEKVNLNQISLPKGWSVKAKLRFQNGGLPVVAVICGPR